MILWIVSAEVSLFYLVCAKELAIIAVAYGFFTAVALFIGFQMRLYQDEKKDRPIRIRYFEFIALYFLLLYCSLTNALAFHVIFQSSEPHPE